MAADVAEVVGYTGDAASPITVLKPAGFAAGHLLLFVLGQDAPGGSLTTLTKPADWADVGNYSAANTQGKVWSHVFDSGDPASWDFGYDGGADVAGMLFRITGADTTPIIVIASSATGPSTGSMTSPTATPTGTDDLLVDVVCIYGAANTLVATEPAGTTDRGQAQLLTFQAIAGASQQLASGSAVGTQTWTSITPANSSGGAFTILVKSGSAVTADVSQVQPQRLPGHLLLQLAARNQATFSRGALGVANADAALNVTAAVTGTIASTKPVDSALTATTTVSGAAATTKPADASLTANASLTAAAAAAKPVDATLTGTAALTAAATSSKPVDAALTVTATITAAADVVAAGKNIDAAPTFTATITPATATTKPVDAALTGTATVTPTMASTKPVASTLTATAAVTPAAAATKSVDVTRSATAAITAAAASTKPVAAALTATATITVAATVGAPPVTIDAAPSFTATVTPEAVTTKPADPGLVGTATITAAGATTKPVTSALTAAATITATASVAPAIPPITFRPSTGITPRPFTGITIQP